MPYKKWINKHVVTMLHHFHDIVYLVSFMSRIIVYWPWIFVKLIEVSVRWTSLKLYKHLTLQELWLQPSWELDFVLFSGFHKSEMFLECERRIRTRFFFCFRFVWVSQHLEVLGILHRTSGIRPLWCVSSSRQHAVQVLYSLVL